LATVYRSGTVVTVPSFEGYRHVDRSLNSADKCFGLAFKMKRKIFDAAHIQALELSDLRSDFKRHKVTGCNLVFLTPTFDEKRLGADWNPSFANESMSRFCESLTKTYGATSYLWVKEFTKHLVPHYHMLVTMPYTPIKDLNRSWSFARGDRYVANALRTGWDKQTNRPKMLVDNYKQAVGYAAKYIGKANSADICTLKMSCKIEDRKTWEHREGHSTKCYGLSSNINIKPIRVEDQYLYHFCSGTLKKMKRFDSITSGASIFFTDNHWHAEKLFQRAKRFSEESFSLDVQKQNIIVKSVEKRNIKPKNRQFSLEFIRKFGK